MEALHQKHMSKFYDIRFDYGFSGITSEKHTIKFHMQIPSFPRYHVKGSISTLVSIFSLSVKTQVAVAAWIYTRIFYAAHWSTFLTVQYHTKLWLYNNTSPCSVAFFLSGSGVCGEEWTDNTGSIYWILEFFCFSNKF